MNRVFWRIAGVNYEELPAYCWSCPNIIWSNVTDGLAQMFLFQLSSSTICVSATICLRRLCVWVCLLFLIHRYFKTGLCSAGRNDPWCSNGRVWKGTARLSRYLTFPMHGNECFQIKWACFGVQHSFTSWRRLFSDISMHLRGQQAPCPRLWKSPDELHRQIGKRQRNHSNSLHTEHWQW